MSEQETAVPSVAKEPARSSRAVGAGLGLAYITAAKVWFMIGGAAINFGLTWVLKSKALVGMWGAILAWVSPLNNVMVTATIQTVSKFASRGPDHVEGAKRAAVRIQAVVGGVAAVAFFVAAPWVARLEGQPALVPGLRIAAVIVLAYSFYAVFVGAANGAREFHKQAGLDATFTTLRAGGVFGGALLFAGVAGAIGGFASAAVAVLVVSVFVVGWRPEREKVASRDLVRFMAPVAAYLLILNLLMFVDGWVLLALVTRAHGVTAGAEANGVYLQVQNVARIPYQAILSVTFVIFPLVSAATFAADADKTRGYVDRSIRLSLLLVAGMAAAVASRPGAVLGLLPRGEYLAGGPALAVLAFGYVGFSMFSIAGTIINGAGRTRPTTIIGALTLALDAGLVWAAVHFALATGRDPLLWAAAATTAAMGAGFVLSLAYLEREFGASLRPTTAARAAVAAGVAILAGRFLPVHGKVGSLVALAVAGMVFFATLFALRELTVGELKALARRKA